MSNGFDGLKSAALSKFEGSPVKRAAYSYLASLIVLIVISTTSDNFYSKKLFLLNDMPLFLVCAFIFSALLLMPARSYAQMDFSGKMPWALALGAILVGYFGHHWILLGYDYSRDEQMASFDEFIFSHGRLVWPLPSIWQDSSASLNRLFILGPAKAVAWTSGYLPVNAALRALVGTLADSAWTGPLLTGLSLPLVWGCARRIWPDDREAAAVSLVLLACSGQALITGMTAFAMPAHLFFNILWLWLFLKDRLSMDLVALAVGFLATGIHQPLFHPLFVAPWMLLLLHERRLARTAVFVVGYAAISIFWIIWPQYVFGLVSGPATANSIVAAPETSYWSRLVAALASNKGNLTLMAANLMRFCMWQHVLLVPLLIAGWSIIRRDRIAMALAVGVLLPIFVMAVILPWQGFGFGYRYVHGVLGNAALLGGFGWRCLADWRERLRSVFIHASLASAFIIVPVQAWMAHRFYAPFVRLDARINDSGADYVIINRHDSVWVINLVLNRPDLSNRPIRLLANEIEDFDELATRICRPGATVALPDTSFYEPVSRSFNVATPEYARNRLAKLQSLFNSHGCGVTIMR